MKMRTLLMGALALGFANAFGEETKENSAALETPAAKAREVLDKLFPGWCGDIGTDQRALNFLLDGDRGQRNVLFVHPKGRTVPSTICRKMTLSDKNPCLFIKVASWNENADFLLSVRVDGKEALSNRLINTPDSEPWQDIVVSLAEWRGQPVKLEIVVSANNWWCEAALISRIEIAEGEGDMRIIEGTEKVGEYTWSYRAQNGEATIIAEKNGTFSRAVSPCPIGRFAIPATLGGARVTCIGRDALADCSAMTSVVIPEGVIRIGRRAFHECPGLRSVKIPSTVKVIGWDAFGWCPALSSVTLPKGITTIDRGAFYDCQALMSIEIPSSVAYIGQDAFLRCRSLVSVKLPSGITDIRWSTFRGCTGLTAMTIPASVTNINYTAFCDTGAMMVFYIENGNRFYKCANRLLLTKDGTTLVRGVNGDVRIPPSVTAVGPCAFEGNVSLRTVVIPDGVKSIDKFAFKQCRGLTSVTIPAAVTNIGQEAFNFCRDLASVRLCGEIPSVLNSSFANCNKLSEIHLPANAKSWAGMKEWQGKKLVFDADSTTADKTADVKAPASNLLLNRTGNKSLWTRDGKSLRERRLSKLKEAEECAKVEAEMRAKMEAEEHAKMEAEKEQKEQLTALRAEIKALRAAQLAAKTNNAGVAVAQELKECDFLLNKDFKQNAKYYLCLFSASWCGPCRAEMPRIAKTYAEKLKDDPDIELIHFSCDQNDEKALAWAKEHNVKFPVVKPNGGNPLNLHPRGIPHLFIVKADGTLVEDGHPMSIFTGAKLRALKTGSAESSVKHNAP